jgi:ATP synthase protein I
VDNLFEDPENDKEKEEFVLGDAPAESAGENARRSGLAFSAGVAFFSAVVFMLVLGWVADRFFGSSPWGIVGGLVLGSIIGFIQLFRLSSQIFKKQ